MPSRIYNYIVDEFGNYIVSEDGTYVVDENINCYILGNQLSIYIGTCLARTESEYIPRPSVGGPTHGGGLPADLYDQLFKKIKSEDVRISTGCYAIIKLGKTYIEIDGKRITHEESEEEIIQLITSLYELSKKKKDNKDTVQEEEDIIQAIIALESATIKEKIKTYTNNENEEEIIDLLISLIM